MIVREAAERRHPPDWGKMRRWFSQAIRWKILLPRRYRVAAWIIGFFLGAVVGTALGVETLLSGAAGAFAFESAVEFWWWRHNRHRQMVARPSGANSSNLG
jgi:hypothetical protein